MTALWTKRIADQTAEHPTRQDVLGALLTGMIQREAVSAWAHFEVIAKDGWLRNRLWGKEAGVEIALLNDSVLQLNPGIPNSKRQLMPAIPEKWPRGKDGMARAPVADLEELILWVDPCLGAVCGRPDYRVTGWIDGA